jgi:hypothetical protein
LYHYGNAEYCISRRSDGYDPYHYLRNPTWHIKKPSQKSNIPETKKFFASTVSDAKATYCHSIAITPGQQFLYKDTSCSLSAIFYDNLHCNDDEPQTAKHVQWRHAPLLHLVLCKERGA